MPHSGYFAARPLGREWAQFALLAEVCAAARLTNRQAQVTLLYLRGLTRAEIARAVHTPWKEVWRSYHRASSKLVLRFPRLQEIAEALQRQHDDTVRLACRCGRNGSAGARSPLLGEDSTYGERRVYAAGGHPALVLPEDLGRVSVTIMDVLPVLLREIQEAAAT